MAKEMVKLFKNSTNITVPAELVPKYEAKGWATTIPAKAEKPARRPAKKPAEPKA